MATGATMDTDEQDARPQLSKYKDEKKVGPVPMLVQGEKYSDLSDEDFEYNMRHRSRGHAVIINNMNFLPMTEMGNRAGSDVDRDNLRKTLRFMGFKEDHIIVENDLPYKSMIKLLSQVAALDFSDSDCLFVAILSHGDEDHIYGIDGPVSINDLIAPFKERGVDSLVGKPKIFLLQACRGSELDEGRKFADDAKTSAKRAYKIAKESDFLIAYSVVPGYYSWRNCTNGSWFVQAFCEVMRHDGRRLEFLQCLTRVNRMVSYTFESNARPEYMSMKKQSPCITSMLTKSLYF